MGRKLTKLAQLTLDSSPQTVLAMRLTLANGQPLAVASEAVFYQGIEHLPWLLKWGGLRFTLGRNADRGNAALQNADGRAGDLALDGRRLFDKARVVVTRLLVRRDEYGPAEAPTPWRGVELFEGLIQPVGVTLDELQLEIVSATASAGIVAASRTLGPLCSWRFRSPQCGYTETDFPSCKKDFGGNCEERGRQDSHNGFVYILPTAPPPPPPPDGIGGIGGGTSGGRGRGVQPL